MKKLSEVAGGMKAVFGEICPHCGKPYSVEVYPEAGGYRVGLEHRCSDAAYDKDHKSEVVQAENDLIQF